MLDAGPARADLDRTTIGIVDQAIGNGNILRSTTAKPENRPPCTETAIVDGHEFIAAKQCTRIVLALHITIGDVYVFAVVEMKTVVVPVDPVINANAIDIYLPATEYSKTMISAGSAECIFQAQVGALIKNDKMQAVEVAAHTMLAGAGIITLPIVKS